MNSANDVKQSVRFTVISNVNLVLMIACDQLLKAKTLSHSNVMTTSTCSNGCHHSGTLRARPRRGPSENLCMQHDSGFMGQSDGLALGDNLNCEASRPMIL